MTLAGHRLSSLSTVQTRLQQRSLGWEAAARLRAGSVLPLGALAARAGHGQCWQTPPGLA